MGVANNLTAILNFLALLCSIPIITSGLWLASKPDNECVHLFRWPVVIIGFLILFVSLAGFIGAYAYKETLLAVYLCCMALLIGLLLFVLIFAFVVTRPDGSYDVPGRGFKEYRLDGYSSWLIDHIVNSENWEQIKACLAETNNCPKLNQNYIITANQFSAAHLSPLQSGCCKPPTLCGYDYETPTTWVNPVNQASDPDCFVWSNDQRLLCYNCNACKAGLLGSLRREWTKANLIMIVAVVLLICVYLIACTAFRTAQAKGLFRRHK